MKINNKIIYLSTKNGLSDLSVKLQNAIEQMELSGYELDSIAHISNNVDITEAILLFKLKQ